MEQEEYNIQRKCEEIHAQYGTSEMANYRIQLMCDKIENHAFEEGRKSVINTIPDLEWEPCSYSFLAHTPFGTYCIEILNNQWYVKYGSSYLGNGINKSLGDSKSFAFNDYKNRIKKALGL